MTDYTITHETKIQDGVYFLLRNGKPSLCPFRPSLMEPTKLGGINWLPCHCNTACPFHNTSKIDGDNILHTLECTGSPLAIKSVIQNSIKSA